MKASAIYHVSGRRTYRGHSPGSVFEASLDAAAEQRAINRGDIRVMQRVTPSLQPGTYELPAGWLKQQEEVPQHV